MSISCAAAARVRLDQEHLLERGDALGRLALLVQAEDRVEHGQADDHDPGRELLQRDDADDRGAEQDELHQVAVLAEERPPARLLLRLGELVRAVLARGAARPRRRRARTRGSTSSRAATSSAVRPCQRASSSARGLVASPWRSSQSSVRMTTSCRVRRRRRRGGARGRGRTRSARSASEREHDRTTIQRAASRITILPSPARHDTRRRDAEDDDAERGQRGEQRPDPAQVACRRARARSRGRPSRRPRSG